MRPAQFCPVTENALLYYSYIKRKSPSANPYQISKNNSSYEQGSVNPTGVKLKQYFISVLFE